jgi:hypothetical protein
MTIKQSGHRARPYRRESDKKAGKTVQDSLSEQEKLLPARDGEPEPGDS